MAAQSTVVKPVLALLLSLLALPAQAQLRTLRVPEGAEVVIPPRGAAPQAPARMATRPRPAEAEPLPADTLAGPNPWTYALLPLAAGAIAALATSLPGGGGTGSSGPVRTR